jgi:hypothetical protein
MGDEPVYIAMWSGPRNISTAMMRSFGNRSDAYVTDEPLYAHYLRETGLGHPGRELTLGHHEADWRKVVAWLTGPVPGGRRVWYQKHMSHHLLAGVGREWLEQVSNCFLIREPREMITSLIEFIPEPVMTDTGLPQQLEIFEMVRRRTGRVPPVVEGKDILDDPRGMLTQLCEAVGIGFDESMLSWPPGLRETDGAWAPAWYAKVEKTTGFGRYKPKDEAVPSQLEHLVPECERIYQELRKYKLQPRGSHAANV